MLYFLLTLMYKVFRTQTLKKKKALIVFETTNMLYNITLFNKLSIFAF